MFTHARAGRSAGVGWDLERGRPGPRIEEFAADIRWGLSYAGADDLATARQNAEFVRVTPTTRRRNGAHGFARTE